MIAAGSLIALITFGARTSFGLFTEPLSDLRHWDRETFALAIGSRTCCGDWGSRSEARSRIASAPLASSRPVA